MKTFKEDSITYNLDLWKEIVVGDLAYSPQSDAIVGVDEENLHYANEEYVHATKVAPNKTTKTKHVCTSCKGSEIHFSADAVWDGYKFIIENIDACYCNDCGDVVDCDMINVEE